MKSRVRRLRLLTRQSTSVFVYDLTLLILLLSIMVTNELISMSIRRYFSLLKQNADLWFDLGNLFIFYDTSQTCWTKIESCHTRLKLSSLGFGFRDFTAEALYGGWGGGHVQARLAALGNAFQGRQIRRPDLTDGSWTGAGCCHCGSAHSTNSQQQHQHQRTALQSALATTHPLPRWAPPSLSLCGNDVLHIVRRVINNDRT